MATSPTVLEYEGSFDLPAPPPAIWAAINEVDAFESWWSWLRELRVDRTPLQSGSVLSGLVVPPIPYRMRLQVALVSCAPPRRIDAEVTGDLVGRAHVELAPDGEGTRAEVGWVVEMMPRAMRLAARLGSPLLRFGHDRVVDMTVTRFRRQLLRSIR
jgi:carbon monoxide dehydrogenase subunit G